MYTDIHIYVFICIYVMVTTCTTKFKIQKSYFVPTQDISVLCMVFRTKWIVSTFSSHSSVILTEAFCVYDEMRYES